MKVVRGVRRIIAMKIQFTRQQLYQIFPILIDRHDDGFVHIQQFQLVYGGLLDDTWSGF